MLRSLWRRPLGRFGLLALLLAGAAAWYVTARGGWVNALHLPPVLDASTPRSQGGYVLSDLQFPSGKTPAAAYLLIKPPDLPEYDNMVTDLQDGTYEYRPREGSIRPIVQATGQTAGGDVTPLPWTLIGDETHPHFVRVEIPGGYSNDSRFIDVTLVTSSGPFPRWRIMRLPNMRRIIPNTPQITDSMTANGVTTTARAWRSRHRIYLQTCPILPPNSHQWEIATNNLWPEWEKFDQPHGQDPIIRMPILGRNGAFADRDIEYGGTLSNEVPADYRSASRYVRQSCTLRQFETYDESVTFHNLAVKADPSNTRDLPLKTYTFTIPYPLTLTTPSGIVVTLPAQRRDAGPVISERINLKLTVQQAASPSDLPHSPLVHQFGKPVTISVKFAPPYDADGYIVAPGDTRTYSLWPPQNPAWRHRTPEDISHTPLFLDLPPVLKDFSVVIHQRVDLQAIPMTFTVPVSDTPPPDVH